MDASFVCRWEAREERVCFRSELNFKLGTPMYSDAMEGARDVPPGDDRGVKRDRDDERSSPPRRDTSRDRRDRRPRDRSRSRDRTDGGQNRGGSRRQNRGARRSRSRSPKRGGDRGGARETSVERVERDQLRERRKEEREIERKRKELETLERDARTVFAYNLSTKADEREIFQFFSAVGTVNDVRIIYDRNTPTSKGMAYVEFQDEKSVEPALATTGQILRNQVVMVKASEAEKNAAWKTEKAQKAAESGAAGISGPGTATNAGTDFGTRETDPKPETRNHIPLPAPLAGGGNFPPPPRSCELCVENVHCDVLEDDLRAVFEPFGEMQSVVVSTVEDPTTKTHTARVTYVNARDAVTAVAQLNGLDLVGHAMRVSMAAATAPEPVQFAQKEMISDSAHGVKMDSRSRAALMAKLAGVDLPAAEPIGIDPQTGLPASAEQMAAARLAAAENAAEVAKHAAEQTQGVLGPASPIPTECVLLKNMFRVEEETEPEWWLDIAEDVGEECETHGAVKHVFVDRESFGFVYLKFGTIAAAEGAKRALHGRWFAGRTVSAEYQFTAVYDRHFNA